MGFRKLYGFFLNPVLIDSFVILLSILFKKKARDTFFGLKDHFYFGWGILTKESIFFAILGGRKIVGIAEY